MGLFETDENCIKQREYVNIPAWHSVGYTGNGINVFCDDVGGNHAACVADIIQTILPDAVVFTGRISSTAKNGKIISSKVNLDSGETYDFDEFIKLKDISLINNSKSTGTDSTNKFHPFSTYMKEKIDEYNLIMTAAAGNAHDGNITNIFARTAILVNSAHLKNGIPVHSLSSIGDEVDFCMFNGFQPGTSFAAPFLLGMIGLLRSKYGRSLTQAEAYEYLKNHIVDIEAKGKDAKTGWGLPVMGSEKQIITLQMGSNILDVDGRKIVMDEAPCYNERGDRMLVPVKFIADAFGCKTEWDNESKTVRFIK